MLNEYKKRTNTKKIKKKQDKRTTSPWTVAFSWLLRGIFHGKKSGKILGGGMSENLFWGGIFGRMFVFRGKCLVECPHLLPIMPDYKSLRVAVMLWATLVNTHTDTRKLTER